MRVRDFFGALLLAAVLPGGALAQINQSNIFRGGLREFLNSSPTGLATGDFDQDGDIDILTANSGRSGGEITVCETLIFPDPPPLEVGCGDNIPLGTLPAALLLDHFDDDGIADLVVSTGDNTILFLKGLGNREYFALPGAPISVGSNPRGLATADLDGDGVLDVVVANEGPNESAPGSVSVLLGRGDGTFTVADQDADPEAVALELPAESGTRAVGIGDVDGDSHLDIVALNSRGDSISVFLGDGEGRFVAAPAVATGPAPAALALHDVNGDQLPDLITADGTEHTISVLLGNGNATFQTRRQYPVGDTPTAVLVVDLNEDGEPDVLVANSRSSDVSLLLGDGSGELVRARTFVADAEPAALALGDVDGDGRDDVVTANLGTEKGPTVALLRNRGGGSLHAVEDILVGQRAEGVASGDVDNDGLPDLVVTTNGGDVLVYRSVGDGSFHTPEAVEVGTRPIGVVAVDLNGDLWLDVAVADRDGDRVAVAFGTGGGSLGNIQTFTTAAQPAKIAAGDFNGDGRKDLAVSAVGPPGQASVLLQQPDGTFGPAQDTAVEETPFGIAAADFNCDGIDDLVVVNNASETVSVLRSNGDGTFTLAQRLPDTIVRTAPLDITVADFDRDGKPDFAVGNGDSQFSAQVFVAGERCDATFELFTEVRAGVFLKAIVARDFVGPRLGDGGAPLVDLAVVNQTSNGVRVLAAQRDDQTGEQSGAFRAHKPDLVSRMPEAITAADFDADGLYDVATANSDPNSRNVSVLMNCVGSPICVEADGAPALRGDANGDEQRSAADLVALAAEVMDGDGMQIEDIGLVGGSFAAAAGVDANGDGRVDAQDGLAVARWIFDGL